MDAIIAALDQLELGSPITAANLTMYPLLLPEESAPGYLTLDEAIAAGLASVTEVSESGSVPVARERFPAIGVGEDVRIASGTIAGGGLVVDGKVVHLVAFPASAHAVSEG